MHCACARLIPFCIFIYVNVMLFRGLHSCIIPTLWGPRRGLHSCIIPTLWGPRGGLHSCIIPTLWVPYRGLHSCIMPTPCGRVQCCIHASCRPYVAAYRAAFMHYANPMGPRTVLHSCIMPTLWGRVQCCIHLSCRPYGGYLECIITRQQT